MYKESHTKSYKDWPQKALPPISGIVTKRGQSNHNFVRNRINKSKIMRINYIEKPPAAVYLVFILMKHNIYCKIVTCPLLMILFITSNPNLIIFSQIGIFYGKAFFAFPQAQIVFSKFFEFLGHDIHRVFELVFVFATLLVLGYDVVEHFDKTRRRSKIRNKAFSS